MGKIIEWSKEEIDYAIENFGKKSYKEIGLHLGRTRGAVMIKMNKLGYKLEKKYYFDSDFFQKIDSHEKSYWLGFIYADGSIYYDKEKRGYYLTIEIKRSDENHLKKLNYSLNGNCKINYRTKTLKENGKSYDVCSIRFYSKSFVNDLINLGVFVNKSKIIKFPKIDEKYFSSFIRGYFDGDGSISIEKRSKQLRCNITCGSKDFLSSIGKILSSMGINYYICLSEPNSECLQLGIMGKLSNRIFLEYIYDNVDVFLKRKYDFYIANKNLLYYLK